MGVAWERGREDCTADNHEPRPPEREGDQLVNLVSPDEVHEGESLQVKDEHTRETPHRHLFCGLTVFLTLRAVPVCTRREDCQKVFFGAQHFWRYFLHQDASELCREMRVVVNCKGAMTKC